ncbi:MAG: bifunctional (p)ppGpp synthetase/guanosine-3',5'-bis(diphosphate) 3'-pyrophosphohydrolase [Gammaproteobacteria bacterium]|nr:bifunctional (p)ppGpp synthetase/guanosine-3',5'-bis(diphosphate) 3'-pyrophosphohydrolase [Gammaproteobacteria bacterium]
MEVSKTLAEDIHNKAEHSPSYNGVLIESLRNALDKYMTPKEIDRIHHAYLFGADAHLNQKRISGEPYIYHPVQVAQIMAELRLDAVTISAGLLHDVLEDTDITKKQLSKQFGDVVAEVVDGVSKLPKLKFESKEISQAKNFQKMLLAMAKDPRVILVKLSDRLHNMRTIHHLSVSKQKRIARETLDIYAPLAQRLGMDKIRLELEDLSFQVLYPLRYMILKRAVIRHGKHKELANKMLAHLRLHLDSSEFSYHMYGRSKHLYSIYRKMKERKHSLTQIFDIYAVRIIVSDIDHCYRMLGLLHNLFRPVPGRFKDYIALPKPNGYQSLHTVVVDPQGVKLEVQIRTKEMEEFAESGIAAYAFYKIGEADKSATTHLWVQNLLNLQEKTKDNSSEYMENLKAELFPAEVYVFTPKGEIIVLPRKATALDFAFAIHTDVGLSTSRVRVNGNIEVLNYRLQSGQTIEVITSDTAAADSRWLEFVVTAKARSAIVQHLKNIESYEAVELGRYLLQQALASYQYRLADISKSRMKEVLSSLELKDENELFVEIGLGRQIPSLVMALLTDVAHTDTHLALEIEPEAIVKGVKGTIVACAKCCYPIPGDAIVGTLNPGKGLVIHREGCANTQNKKVKKILLNWSSKPNDTSEYSTAIRIVVPHRRGVLATLASKIAQTGSNIEDVLLDEQGMGSAAITFVISVRDTNQLNKIIRRISQAFEGVRVSRVGPS